MSEPTAPESLLSLPLLTDHPANWQGFSPLYPLPSSIESPEPVEPQGVYAAMETECAAPASIRRGDLSKPGARELWAPAGGPEAAYAAFHFGADAIYLGLKKFSARAEAENFTLEELDEVTAYAHRLAPRRRVFVTINTLIRQDELPELIEALAALVDIGIDAVIVQ